MCVSMKQNLQTKLPDSLYRRSGTLPSLKHELALFLSAQAEREGRGGGGVGVTVTGEEVVVGASSTELLTAVFLGLLAPGDQVLVLGGPSGMI